MQENALNTLGKLPEGKCRRMLNTSEKYQGNNAALKIPMQENAESPWKVARGIMQVSFP